MRKPEIADALVHDLGLLFERLGGGRILLHQRRIALGHLIHLGQRLVDLIDAVRLLQAGAGNVRHKLRDFLDGGGDFIKCRTGLVHELDTLLNLAARIGDEVLDVLRGLRGALRQRAHFRCDHRETAPGIAGARRFDRGVERQEVGLPGDLVDDADDIGDLAGRRFDLRHCRNRIGHHLAAAIRNVARLGGRALTFLRPGWLTCATLRQTINFAETCGVAAVPVATMNNAAFSLPLFGAPFAPPDEDLAAGFLIGAGLDAAAERRIDARARGLVEAIRARAGGLGGIEDFLHAYSLSTKEGLALMVLAEALLRVPDAATADRLIEDKLAAGRWFDGDVKSTALLVSASAWTLGIAARIIHPGETPRHILDAIVKRLGLPALRTATRQAMRLIGWHFVLGQTIDEALARARSHREFRYSFDMLGEGARTADDAEKYFDAYAGAIAAIGASAGNAAWPARPGISVKLSALHPRFEAISRERVLAELPPRVAELARMAKAHELGFTIDAEEADRLELSLEVIGAVLGNPALRGFEGFGLAVQAYQKRALAVIDWTEEAAAAFGSRLTIRLVKGAYWDTEIKRAQERGLPDYPVFTRKAMTDLCYMACARKLLAARERIFPQFATHNALTVASIIEDAGGVEGYEFQRLHGMGEALYETLLGELPRHRLPRLCAGRRPPRSPRLSGAALAGKRRQLVLRLGRRRSERADRRYSAPPAKRDREPARGAQQKDSAAARSLPARAAKLAAASNSASAQA